ncbi:MAG TPA: outer membrane beta-barrel protein [candidate division Zixibacteria bacterium]|nr:outer membrane beta-barrel protein [candidate division Zixibacteria bacterium]
MRRIFILGVALALTAAMAAGVLAHEPKGMVTASLGGGLLLPMGDFGDYSKLGWRVVGTGGYFVTNNIAIGPTVAFSNNKVKDVFLTANPTITDAKTQIIEFGAWGQYFFGEMEIRRLVPYIKAGLGGYNAKFKTESSSGSTSTGETNLGINGGGGAMYWLTPQVNLFLEGGFHNIFSDPSANYLTVSTGVGYLFGHPPGSHPQ